MKNLFNMTFAEICKDFNDKICNRSPIRTGIKPLVSLPFESENDSTNNIITRWIINNGFPYLHTFNGDVWFSQDGETWESTVREVNGEMVHFYTAR